MTDLNINVLASGAVCLGTEVVCDGFSAERPYRVQTHIHDDHMGNFNRSKGSQNIILSPETYDLLVAEHNADLSYRDNLHRIDRDDEYVLNSGSKLSLIPSGHMLGSCQVLLEQPDGFRIGYSGDFGWPIDDVIKVDVLVVDSTYGSPRSIRRYTQAEAERCLLEVVCQRLRYGPVHVSAYRGTIERVLQVLDGRIEVPILASDRLVKEVEVYQTYGFTTGVLKSLDSDVGQAAMKEHSYIRLYSKGDGFGNEQINGTSVTCSAYMVDPGHPLMIQSDRSYRVALSNHADFHETLAYVEKTGAKRVITDNTRNHGVELAIAINNSLQGVCAEPSTNLHEPDWD